MLEPNYLVLASWAAVSAARRVQMCRQMTEMYLEFRQLPRDSAEPWVWEAIDGLHPELVGVIAESLPTKENDALMKWMLNGIAATQTRNAVLEKQLNDLPF